MTRSNRLLFIVLGLCLFSVVATLLLNYSHQVNVHNLFSLLAFVGGIVAVALGRFVGAFMSIRLKTRIELVVGVLLLSQGMAMIISILLATVIPVSLDGTTGAVGYLEVSPLVLVSVIALLVFSGVIGFFEGKKQLGNQFLD